MTDLSAAVKAAEEALVEVQKHPVVTRGILYRALRDLLDAVRTPDDPWEYGLVNDAALPGEYGRDDRDLLVSNSRDHIERLQRRGHPSIKTMRRRKAGPWEEVPDE